jgi:hypothetical protein
MPPVRLDPAISFGRADLRAKYCQTQAALSRSWFIRHKYNYQLATLPAEKRSLQGINCEDPRSRYKEATLANWGKTVTLIIVTVDLCKD